MKPFFLVRIHKSECATRTNEVFQTMYVFMEYRSLTRSQGCWGMDVLFFLLCFNVTIFIMVINPDYIIHYVLLFNP